MIVRDYCQLWYCILQLVFACMAGHMASMNLQDMNQDKIIHKYVHAYMYIIVLYSKLLIQILRIADDLEMCMCTGVCTVKIHPLDTSIHR